MNVLIVSSGNNRTVISPIVRNQGESLKELGLEVFYFPILGKGLLGYLKNIYPLRQYLRKNKFDVIHAHYGLCGIVSLLAMRKEKIVVSFMGDDLLGSVNQKRLYSVSGKVLKLINIYFSKWYDHVIVKSEEMAKTLNHKRMSILPNGVDLESFYPIDKVKARKFLNIGTRKKLIIFVSNPERPEKNYPLAQNTYNSLNKKDVLLVPVYDKEQKVLSYYYSAADLLLMTSIHEGSPNVIKEAMACNCPIVSTAVGDVRNLIGNIEGCYLVEIDKHKKHLENDENLINNLSKAVERALYFAEKKGRTNGRSKLIDNGLTSDNVAHKILDIYNQVLS